MGQRSFVPETRFGIHRHYAPPASICERLGEVNVPTLVIWTPEDRIQRPEHGADWQKRFPMHGLSRLETVTR